jgi:hypothetical protein
MIIAMKGGPVHASKLDPDLHNTHSPKAIVQGVCE